MQPKKMKSGYKALKKESKIIFISLLLCVLCSNASEYAFIKHSYMIYALDISSYVAYSRKGY